MKKDADHATGKTILPTEQSLTIYRFISKNISLNGICTATEVQVKNEY